MMTALDQTEFVVVAIAVVAIAYLVYRVLKGEPFDRIVRLGIFIERHRHKNGGEEEQTERVEWPRRKEDE